MGVWCRTIGPSIELDDVTKRFRTPRGTFYVAVHSLTCAIARGEFCAIVGPTGSGKSTTLNLIAGLQSPSRGHVSVLGKPVTTRSENVGYMFQTDAIFPWKNVLQNVATGPLYRAASRGEAARRAREGIGRVGLAGFEDRDPNQVGGGMRKRGALPQTLIKGPAGPFVGGALPGRAGLTRGLRGERRLGWWARKC